LTKYTDLVFFNRIQMEAINSLSVRRGTESGGSSDKTAELPKVEPTVRCALYLKLKGGDLNDESGVDCKDCEGDQDLESVS
jgi:hypothetical protein